MSGIPSASTLVSTSHFTKAELTKKVTQQLTYELNKVLDAEVGKPFKINIDQGSNAKPIIERVLHEAGYRVDYIEFSSWRNENSASITLTIPPQEE